MGKAHGFLKFIRNDQKGSDDDDIVYDVVNKHKDDLGDIGYFDSWKTWIFSIEGVYFDKKCLREIADFLEKLDNKTKGEGNVRNNNK